MTITTRLLMFTLFTIAFIYAESALSSHYYLYFFSVGSVGCISFLFPRHSKLLSGIIVGTRMTLFLAFVTNYLFYPLHLNNIFIGACQKTPPRHKFLNDIKHYSQKSVYVQ